MHNHFQSGSCALEDVWHTKNLRRRQFAEIFTFCFTNGYLAMKHFSDSLLPHFKFKMTAAAALTTYKSCSIVETRSLLNITEETIHEHPLLKIRTSRRCYMCHHYLLESKGAKLSTTFKCGSCKIPLCKPSKGNPYNKHLKGLPEKSQDWQRLVLRKWLNIQSFWYDVILYPN